MKDEPQQPEKQPKDQPEPQQPPVPIVMQTGGGKLKKILLSVAAVVVVGAIAGGAWWLGTRHNKSADTAKTASPNTQATTTTDTKSSVLSVDPDKNYGNKYADGILPVGDGKYSSTEAKKGTVYACSTYATNIANTQNAGADTRGPWFTNNNTEYDLNKKVSVSGSVTWQHSFSNTVSGSTRTIVTNDLPEHHTGTFPIASSDAAYQYDRNPNSISAQSLSYALAASPTYGDPQCMGGAAGVMLTGVALFNGFDAGGRDAGAWEVQDDCDGHPQSSGEYHYHTLSTCISDTSVETVIGFALDGFPITGPKVGMNNYLTTDDLDECHGITSKVMLDGKLTETYHYVMTQDFPYSVSCFRSKPIDPPGEKEGQGNQQLPPKR